MWGAIPSAVMLVSDAGAESPLLGPFTSLISEEIASPPVGTWMLQVSASWGSLHKRGQAEDQNGQDVL